MSDERKDDKGRPIPATPPEKTPKREERVTPIRIPNDPPEDEWVAIIIKNQKMI